MNSLKFFQVILILVSVFIIVLCSRCGSDDPEPIIVIADIPASFAIGLTDTLKFRITSEAPLDSVELWEGSKNYACFGKDKMVTDTEQDINYILTFNLNFLYTPVSPAGLKNMELRVKSSTHRKNTQFSVNVID
ncbi:MAG: hypothetical protein JXB00_04570 [Bacteroidales bacterium]|nr:hypothetical protein [Bacteroidales bacterium]